MLKFIIRHLLTAIKVKTNFGRSAWLFRRFPDMPRDAANIISKGLPGQQLTGLFTEVVSLSIVGITFELLTAILELRWRLKAWLCMGVAQLNKKYDTSAKLPWKRRCTKFFHHLEIFEPRCPDKYVARVRLDY